MIKWPQQLLDETLDEALRDGVAIRAPEPDDPGEARALRQALYNRALRRGLEGLTFGVEGTHVAVRRKRTKNLRVVQQPEPRE